MDVSAPCNGRNGHTSKLGRSGGSTASSEAAAELPGLKGIGWKNLFLCLGYIAIYKVSFSITLFFITMFFITIGVTTSKGVRACIHNGFWLLKVIT